ncbi:hypothetical protein EW146_g512 [Bondarzewia mesenterica]|uniref:Uncharacterized protein n=1 Tax=Bondarzewia mesenterica TaxID=1095465 RepID=A0A4S4M8L1_9AGAM|nr:hypothetical protein EW146_g512 [Bondarzewia mesenterica]
MLRIMMTPIAGGGGLLCKAACDVNCSSPLKRSKPAAQTEVPTPGRWSTVPPNYPPRDAPSLPSVPGPLLQMISALLFRFTLRPRLFVVGDASMDTGAGSGCGRAIAGKGEPEPRSLRWRMSFRMRILKLEA